MFSYQSSDLNFKPWKRFWKALNAYKIGKTNEEVLQAFFGAKSSANVTTHKKIINFHTSISRNILFFLYYNLTTSNCCKIIIVEPRLCRFLN